MDNKQSNITWSEQVKEAKAGRFQELAEAKDYHATVNAKNGNRKLKNVIEVEHVINNSEGKVLDVGAGNGRISIPLCDAGREVTATDISASMLEVAREAAGNRKMSWQVADVESLPFKDNEFDTVISVNVLLHIPQWKQAVREFLRVTKPGGRIIFDLRSADMLANANKGKNKYSTAAHPGDPQGYFTEVSLDEMLKFVEENGYHLDKLIPHNIVNGNFWLEDFLGPKWLEFSDLFTRYLLESAPVFDMWCFVERTLIHRLPLDLFYGYLVVFKKDAPGARNYPVPLPKYKSRTITSFIQECLGSDYSSFQQGLVKHARASKECIEFLDCISQYVLCKIDPKFSPDEILGDLRKEMGMKPFSCQGGKSFIQKVLSRLIPNENA